MCRYKFFLGVSSRSVKWVVKPLDHMVCFLDLHRTKRPICVYKAKVLCSNRVLILAALNVQFSPDIC